MGIFGPAYPKINSLWKRDKDKHNIIIPGDFAQPEFEDLRHARWTWTEKIDGTNIRLFWNGSTLTIGGKTDNANIPAPLYKELEGLLTEEMLAQQFGYGNEVTLFGEGYGAGIQKGGEYRATPGFILFDVVIGGIYLTRESVQDVAIELGLDMVAEYGISTLADAWDMMVDRRYESTYPDHELEGIVGRPVSRFYVYTGHSISPLLCKMKYVDISSWEAFHGVSLKDGLPR
jgi:RNA ligase